jgi:hypothetical protein
VSHRADVKRRKREQLRQWLREVAARRPDRYNRTPYEPNCFSATCAECGRVWISAVRPIKPNAKRGRRSVYLCAGCR